MRPAYFDSHVHTYYSNDSYQTVEEIWEATLDKGLLGVSITDQANMASIQEDQTF